MEEKELHMVISAIARVRMRCAEKCYARARRARRGLARRRMPMNILESVRSAIKGVQTPPN
eukprot:6048149-Heterocapsa_arctica.AAC.1